MTIETAILNDSLGNIVKKAMDFSTQQTTKEFASKLAEIDLKKNLTEGISDLESGNFEEITKQNTENFLKEIEKEISPNK